MSWQEALWAELDQMDDLTQVRIAAEWIDYVTHELSPALARRRREKVLDLLAQDDMDATRLGEEIGASRNAIKRLAEEGRTQRREQDRRVA